MTESNISAASGDSAPFGGRCPWCGQPTEHSALTQELRAQVADELDVWIRGAQTTGGQEGIWFARGLSFASMWLRGANDE
jgi:hypothetical protein